MICIPGAGCALRVSRWPFLAVLWLLLLALELAEKVRRLAVA
jgi:hypothetical protein